MATSRHRNISGQKRYNDSLTTPPQDHNTASLGEIEMADLGDEQIVTGYQPLDNRAASGRKRWHSASTQVALLGLICFCCPGMWNSITSMAGGIDPQVVSNATATLYTCFTITSILSPAFCNKFGPRLALFVGSLGYVAYAVSLLVYHWHASSAMVVAAGAFNGIGAGLLWTAQGQMMLAYPNQEQQGVYVAIFWIIFNLGAVVGGGISFAANFNSAQEDPSTGTYVAFISVMVIGSALCLSLTDPSQVVRPDGTLVQIQSMPSWSGEVKAMLNLVLDRRVLCLLPLFIYSNWFYTYQFGCFNAKIFNARTQGLSNMAFWGAQMGGAYAIGVFLDSSRKSVRYRALTSFVCIAVYISITWGFTLLVNETYSLNSGKKQDVDFHNRKAFLGPFFLYFAFGLSDSFIQCWSYWLFGKMTDDSSTLSRFTGIYKAVQSAGGAISWKLNGGNMVPLTQIYINIGLVIVSMPLALLVAFRIGINDQAKADLLSTIN